MRKRLLVFLFTGCSWILDPAKVEPNRCSTASEDCVNRPQSLAACVESACVYTCSVGFVDGDGDLNSTGANANGCERSCGADAKPEAPAKLVAVAGERPKVIRFDFDSPAQRPLRFRLCQTKSPSTCTDFEADKVCQDTRCQVERIETSNASAEYSIQSVDACGNVSEVTPAQRVTIAPLTLSVSDDWQVGSNCSTKRITFSPELGVSVNQDNQIGCLTTVLSSSTRWNDVTVLLKVRVNTLSRTKPQVGAAVRGQDNDEQWVGVLTPSIEFDSEPAKLAKSAGKGLIPLAAGIRGTTRDQFQWMGLSVKDSQLRLSLFSDSFVESPVAVWRGTIANGGRIGLAIADPGSTEIQEIRAIVPSLPSPALSSTDNVWPFAAALPVSTLRVQPDNVNSAVACPAFPAGPCANGTSCLPAPGSRCLVFERSLISYAYAGFEPPFGLDVSRDWTLSFRAAVDGASTLMTLVKFAQGEVLVWPEFGPLTSNGTAVGSLDRNAWNFFEVKAQVANKKLSIRLNGGVPVEVPIPNQWLGLSGSVSMPAGLSFGKMWLTDVRIRQ